MTLRDELSHYQFRSGPVCTVRTMLEDAGEQRDEIAELISDKRVTASSLSRLLQDHGYEISQSTITRHRRKECSCDNA